MVASGDGTLAVGASEGRLVAVGLDAEGLIEKSFGRNGLAYFGGGGKVAAVRDAQTVGGKILVAGNLGPRGARHRCWPCGRPLLARLLPSGRPDPSFGRRGISLLPRLEGRRQNAPGEELAPLPNGKILLLGGFEDSAETSVLGRFRSDGNPDRRFGSGGVVRFEPCGGTKR